MRQTVELRNLTRKYSFLASFRKAARKCASFLKEEVSELQEGWRSVPLLTSSVLLPLFKCVQIGNEWCSYLLYYRWLSELTSDKHVYLHNGWSLLGYIATFAYLIVMIKHVCDISNSSRLEVCFSVHDDDDDDFIA